MAVVDPNMYSVLITALTILGGASAWRFYERRAMHKEKDEDFIRHDCKDRIAKLEALLTASGKEKDDLRNMILDLTKQVAALSVKVEFLTKENEKLKSKSPKQQLNG
jgi:peptidoglycan hydrolase CwlO-like protein